MLDWFEPSTIVVEATAEPVAVTEGLPFPWCRRCLDDGYERTTFWITETGVTMCLECAEDYFDLLQYREEVATT